MSVTNRETGVLVLLAAGAGAAVAILAGAAARRRDVPEKRFPEAALTREKLEALVVQAEESERWLPPADRRDNVADRRARQTLRAAVEEEAAKAGIDLKRVEKIHDELEAARRARSMEAEARELEALQARAARRPALRVDRLRAEDANIETVDTMLFIRSFAGQGAAWDTRLERFDNFARYHLLKENRGGGKNGTGRLGFFALWQNQGPGTRIQIDALIELDARMVADNDADGIGCHRLYTAVEPYISGTLRLRTTIRSVSSGNIEAVVMDEQLGTVQIEDQSTFGGEDRKSFSFGRLYPSTPVFVPRGEYVLIEVALITEWWGDVRVDAGSEGLGMRVPALFIHKG